MICNVRIVVLRVVREASEVIELFWLWMQMMRNARGSVRGLVGL